MSHSPPVSGLLYLIYAGYLNSILAQQKKKLMSDRTAAEQIASLRNDLLRFAQLQLRDATLAEDAVHEAINAALASNQYKNKGSLKNWVFAILRNKIIDVIRERSRHSGHSYIEDDTAELDAQFDAKGHWKKNQQPANWQHPENTLANNQFWEIFELCLNHLPQNTARVFMMREHLGLNIPEICSALSISESNCWVIMHRARAQLRLCLEKSFSEKHFLQPE